MELPTYIIDTFTAVQFSGNPTGVCILREEVDSNELLLIAQELNLPVTAFIKKKISGSDQYDIKYFTTTTEIPACGHATLVSAKVASLRGSNTTEFYTINGIVIKTTMNEDMITMIYPKYELEDFFVSHEILLSLGIENYQTAGYCSKLETLFLVIDNPRVLRNLEPDYSRLSKSNQVIKEVVVTSVSDDKKYDFLLRSFCPWIGIDEDPVTGSVHSVLAGLWADRLNKNELKAYQASKRGGELFITAYNNQTKIGGKATIILEGNIKLLSKSV